jgi:hypothetical protein
MIRAMRRPVFVKFFSACEMEEAGRRFVQILKSG